jgi:hypothetical protein
MDFFRVWLAGYYSPSVFAQGLKGKPAPQWGLYGQGLRALVDALLLYLPLAVLGRQPSMPSFLTFLPTERYYAASVVLAPVFLVAQWLLLSAVVHVILRLARRPSDFDQILNLTGMASLVVGAVLVIWDWAWVSMGWQSDVLLGISHLVLVLWYVVLTTVGFRQLLGLPVWLGILLNLLWLLLGEPLGVLFMRGPV